MWKNNSNKKEKNTLALWEFHLVKPDAVLLLVAFKEQTETL